MRANCCSRRGPTSTVPEPHAGLAGDGSAAPHDSGSRTLSGDGPGDEAEVSSPQWLAGWLAAENLLRLLTEAPDRIKQCAHPQCVLWFYDTTKNAARRWHSMETCGNRAKAARHYAAKKT
jgi:predicted RNA-binding Zn ribbon-like protein